MLLGISYRAQLIPKSLGYKLKRIKSNIQTNESMWRQKFKYIFENIGVNQFTPIIKLNNKLK